MPVANDAIPHLNFNACSWNDSFQCPVFPSSDLMYVYIYLHMHLMKNHAQLGQSERGILHLAPERSQWHSQQSSHLEEKKKRRGSGCADFFLVFFLDLIYTFPIKSFMFEVTHLKLSCESCRRLQRPQTACAKVSPNRTTIKCTTVGIRREHQVPSDHDCKAEDLSLELFRCSAANQRGETRRQDTEGHASEINDENMAMAAMVNAETLRRFGECPFLNIFQHSSCSSHLFTLLVCIACC